MNFNERSNYMIALILSLAFHCFLLLLFIPGYLNSAPAEIETFPVGLVEIAAGSPDGTIGMAGQTPAEIVAAPAVINNPGTEERSKEKTVITPKITPKVPPEDAILLPKKEGTGKESEAKKPVQAGPSAGANGGSGVGGKGDAGKPFGFGTGEGMVTVLGALPTYPKNAMNEGKEGTVEVKILVKADGSLEQVRPTQSSGDLRLDKAAVSVIERTWKFKPVTKDYFIDLTFSFNIQTGVSLKFINSESRP
jgi:TonB family protein